MSNHLCLSKILIFMYCISFLKIVSIHLVVFDWPFGLGFDYLFAAAAKSLQSCSTLCIPIDGSPPGSPIPGILQARALEWVAISFSNAWKWKVTVKSLSPISLLVTPWTAAYQSAPSMGFSRQEYRSGLPLPSADYLFSVLIFCFVSNNSNNCSFLSFLIILQALAHSILFSYGFHVWLRSLSCRIVALERNLDSVAPGSIVSTEITTWFGVFPGQILWIPEPNLGECSLVKYYQRRAFSPLARAKAQTRKFPYSSPLKGKVGFFLIHFLLVSYGGSKVLSLYFPMPLMSLLTQKLVCIAVNQEEIWTLDKTIIGLGNRPLAAHALLVLMENTVPLS